MKKRLCELFNLFVKTVKARLVYPASSRLPQQFQEEFFGRLDLLLEEQGHISFKVEADRIFYETCEVYKAQSKVENFAHTFFRDGILSFKFKKGLLQMELETFVEIVSRMMRSASVDDDLATLLWEAAFEHISYKLMDDVFNIETFEYGTDSLVSRMAPSKADLRSLYENEINLDITEDDLKIPSEERKKKQRDNPYLEIADNVGEFLKKVTAYDDAEKAAIAKLLSSSAAFEYKQYALNLLFEILGLETDNAGYHESLELFAKMRDDFIKAGDYHSAVTILTRIRELEQAFKNLKDLKLDKIQGFIESFAAPEKIKIVVDSLNQQKDVDYDKVAEYLSALPWQAIGPLIGALGELAHFPGRKAVCRALAVLSVDKVELLGRGIDDPRWYVVRNIVSILGKINNPKALSLLKRTVQHPDIRVRKETIAAAARIRSDEAYNFLIMALDDDDERLQITALKELVAQKVVKSYPQIEKIIKGEDFRDCSADQIKEFLEAMAQLGGEKAFLILKKMATRITILAPEKQKRLKNYAVRALGYVQAAEAGGLLQKIAKSRNHALADTARRALGRKLKGD